MRVLIIGFIALAFAGLMCACDQKPEHDPTKVRGYRTPEEKMPVPTWVTVGMDTLDISFASCKAPGSGSKHLASLGFNVAGAPEPLTMELTDPKNPRGLTHATDYCGVELTPRLGKPDVTSEKREECAVPGYFDLVVNLPGGKKLADFRLNEIGRLEVFSDTVDPRYDVELLSTTLRKIYAVYPHRGPGQELPLLFALEYIRDDTVTTRTLEAGDGWTYSFTFAAGRLNLLPPECLVGWPEYLRVLAADEDVNRRAVAEQNARKLKGEDCGSGG